MLRLSRRVWVALEFAPCDLWVGAFVSRKPANYGMILGHCREDLHVYVCLLPCLPVHVVIAWTIYPFRPEAD